MAPEEQPGRLIELADEGEGIFTGRDPAGLAGDRYYFVFDGSTRVPDIASRFQPEGVFGPSEVIDPRAYAWTDSGWRRPVFRERVIYELHIGTFTPEGTCRALIGRLEHLQSLGINTIEIMPVADFPGKWNWGYDGVMLFAPARCYGRPDDFRALVDAAHRRGIAVMLDVVYNHLGPIGNHLSQYTHYFYHGAKDNSWGTSFNFDGEHSRQIRDFFVQNAVYWIDEFHLDGLRLDATHAVDDRSAQHIFAEVAAAVGARGAFTVAEDERNEASIVTSRGSGAWGVDGVWADDHHHCVRVALTGEQGSYYSSYRGTPEELADILRNGWLFRGQLFPHWKRARGTVSAHLPSEKFVVCISNHDQVGNRPLGDRLSHLAAPGAYRSASVLLCLSPYTPMLFMGQEWAADTPFLYFTDQPGELGRQIGAWRRKEFASQKHSLDPSLVPRIPDPQDESTFFSSKLNWDEPGAPEHRGILALYQACLHLRAAHAHFRNPPRARWTVAVVGDLIALRWRQDAGDWLLLFSLSPGEARGGESRVLRPRARRHWKTELFSEDPRFGGTLPAPSFPDGAVRLAGPSAWLLREN